MRSALDMLNLKVFWKRKFSIYLEEYVRRERKKQQHNG